MNKQLLYTITSGRKDKKTIVFLHGFMGSSHDFREISEKLSDTFYCVIPDLPGHGNSLFKTGAFSELKDFMSVVKLTGEFLQSMGLENYCLYGYSMGGRIAAGMALVYPERIDSLILESSSFGIKADNERKDRYQKDLDIFSDIDSNYDFHRFLDSWYRLPLFNTLDEKQILSMVEKRYKNDYRELEQAMRIMSTGNQPYLLGELARMDLDISYIHGEKDEKYSSESLSASREIPRMKIVTVKRASHNVHAQFPEKVVSIIREVFL